MDNAARLMDNLEAVCAKPASMLPSRPPEAPRMNIIKVERNAQPPTHLLAGALAHLAQHMETGCPRAAYLAAMLLERIAVDPNAEPYLRAHARELIDILERDPVQAGASKAQAGALARSNGLGMSGQGGLL